MLEVKLLEREADRYQRPVWNVKIHRALPLEVKRLDREAQFTCSACLL
jgi:hypothetical protein